jgi:hypothetical protein
MGYGGGMPAKVAKHLKKGGASKQQKPASNETTK